MQSARWTSDGGSSGSCEAMVYTIRVRKLEGDDVEELFNPWELHCPEIPFTHYAAPRDNAIAHARGLVYIVVGNRPVPPTSISFRVKG